MNLFEVTAGEAWTGVANALELGLNVKGLGVVGEGFWERGF